MCANFSSMGVVEESAVEWKDGEHYVLTINPLEKAPLLKEAYGRLAVREEGTGTRVMMTGDYTLKFVIQRSSRPSKRENVMTSTPGVTPPPISADFPFASQYVDVLGSQMHYVDEGEGDPILFLHGQPTSSYLWRNIIPHVSTLGRALAPDLIGMGRSDKPDLEYRFVDHVAYVDGFIKALGLKNITLVIHDWGSALGFHYAMRHADTVKGLVFMEAILAPIPSWDAFPQDFAETFKAFRTPEVGWDLLVNQNVFVEQILPAATVRKLTEEEMNHYRAPFADPAHRKPVWRWPNELPIEGEPADVTEAVATYNQWLQKTEIPKLLFYATPGAIMPAPLVEWCRQHLSNLQTIELGSGLHYLQEDHPHQIGAALAAWYEAL